MLACLVLSGSISELEVTEAVISGKVVVLQTMRTDAEKIYDAAKERIETQSEDGAVSIVHSTAAPEPGDESSFFFNMILIPHEPTMMEPFVLQAVEQWNEDGSPDRFETILDT